MPKEVRGHRLEQQQKQSATRPARRKFTSNLSVGPKNGQAVSTHTLRIFWNRILVHIIIPLCAQPRLHCYTLQPPCRQVPLRKLNKFLKFSLSVSPVAQKYQTETQYCRSAGNARAQQEEEEEEEVCTCTMTSGSKYTEAMHRRAARWPKDCGHQTVESASPREWRETVRIA